MPSHPHTLTPSHPHTHPSHTQTVKHTGPRKERPFILYEPGLKTVIMTEGRHSQKRAESFHLLPCAIFLKPCTGIFPAPHEYPENQRVCQVLTSEKSLRFIIVEKNLKRGNRSPVNGILLSLFAKQT